VNAVPGCSPIFPVIVVVPVLVIVEPAKTAKLDVVPRFTGVWDAIVGVAMITNSNSVSSNDASLFLLRFFTIFHFSSIFDCFPLPPQEGGGGKKAHAAALLSKK